MSASTYLTYLAAVPPFLSRARQSKPAERRDRSQSRITWIITKTHQETKYALPTQRKIPIGRNRYACQSNLIRSNYAINNFRTEC
jgi:hypothetical protein